MDKIVEVSNTVKDYLINFFSGPYDNAKLRSIGGVCALAGFILYQTMRNYGMLFKKSLKNEIIFVTGAGSGIGKLMSILMAKQGAKLVIADVNEAGANTTRDLIVRDGNVAISVKCDVTDPASIKAAADFTREKLGEPTILVNNAGIVSGKKILQNDLKKMELVMKVNTISHFYTIREFLPSMMKNNHGHIVTVASIAGTVGVASMVDYCASKFGAVGVHESIRNELRGQGSRVRATLIAPYYIDTGMFDGVQPGPLGFLKEKWVAKRIVNGIRQNENVIIMPYLLHFMNMVKQMLPDWLVDLLLDLFKANSSMDDFTGRK